MKARRVKSTCFYAILLTIFACAALLVASPAAAQQINIEKATNGVDADTPPGPTLVVGDPVNWTYAISNTSARDLVAIVVTDDQGEVVTCPVTTLAADESTVCTAESIVQLGQYANIGTATALLPLGGQVSATNASHYFGIEVPPIPALGIRGLLLTFLLMIALARHSLRKTAQPDR